MQTNYSTNQENVKYLDINYEVRLLHSLDDEFHKGQISLPEMAFSRLWLGWIDKHCEDMLRVIAHRIYDNEFWIRDSFEIEIITPDNIPCYDGGVYITCEANGYKITGNAYNFGSKNEPVLDVEFVAAEKM